MCQTKTRANMRTNPKETLDSFMISVLQFTITDYDKSTVFCHHVVS